MLGLIVTTTVPPYFDLLIPAVRAGQTGRFVHLGWWDVPPAAQDLAARGAFEQAQVRLNDRLLRLADLHDGQRVADVGCGFGGTIAVLNAHHHDLRLIGLNIDERQLALCANIVPQHGNRLQWLQADALSLPLPDGSVDRLLCVEAMFHFGSRRAFLREAARVLAPRGVIVSSDIVAIPGQPDDDAVREAVLAGFGPWPDFWGADADPQALAEAAGLRCTQLVDASAATLPSHVYTAPPPGSRPRNPIARAAAALADLHRAGRLKYPLLRLEHRSD